MRSYLILCLLVGQILCQQVHFSFYSDRMQKFEVPFDTTLRAYQVPFGLIDEGQSPMLKVVFDGCETRVFHVDNIRFPSNAYIDFEDGLPDLTVSAGISEAVVVEHPSDSGFVLQIQLDPNHSSKDTLHITHPDSWYPAVPERVGITFQASSPVALGDYFIPPEMGRYDVSVENWDYRTSIIELLNEETMNDTTILMLKSWTFYGEPDHEALCTYPIYKQPNLHPEQLIFEDRFLDFGAKLFELVGADSSSDSWLVDEYYQEYFYSTVFVKKISLSGPIGRNLYFAYGLGLIRQDFPGTSVHEDLVAIQDHSGTTLGDLNLPISLSLTSSYNYEGSVIFPPDTNWYYYTIPLVELFGYDPAPTTMDSLYLSLGPQINVSNNNTGRLLINDLSLWQDENQIFNFGALEHDDWLLNTATNGSEMAWQYSQDVPPNVSGNSSLLYFANEWEWGDTFAGFAEYTAHFSIPLNVESAHLKFWMKQPLMMSAIDDSNVVQPDEYGVTSAYPNPFNGEVTFTVVLPEDSHQHALSIYDIQGHEILTIQVEGTQGLRQVSWRGNDQHGHKVVSGVYFSTLMTNGKPAGQIQKIIMLK